MAKYGNGVATEDILQSIAMLRERNMDQMSPEVAVSCNEFRQDRLYIEEIDGVYKPKLELLRAIYKRYVLRLPNGKRPKLMRPEGWQALCDHCHFISDDFTIRDVNLAFLRAQMNVADEIGDRTRFESMTFMDFLEALARVADQLILPTDAQVEAMGLKSALQWALQVEAGDRGKYDGVTVDEYHKVQFFSVR